MQPKISRKNQNHCIMLWPHFLSFSLPRLFHKNENWTFLKMSKSSKNSRELEFKKLPFYTLHHNIKNIHS